MTLILETGAGVRNANSYVTTSFVTTYLTERNRETENSWSTAVTADQEAAIIAATDFIEKKFASRFRGYRQFNFLGASAEGSVSFAGLPSADETLTVGSTIYTFKSTLTGASNEILIGATAADTATNTNAAINASADDIGTLFGNGTTINTDASATVDSTVITLVAAAPGEPGNDTTLSDTATNVTVTAFSGGKDSGSQPLSFPRAGLYDAAGAAVTGIPRPLRQATAEYAVRALAAKLAPDLTTDASGGSVKRKLEQVGPIIEETEYVDGTFNTITLVPYPEADKLLSQYLAPKGVIR